MPNWSRVTSLETGRAAFEAMRLAPESTLIPIVLFCQSRASPNGPLGSRRPRLPIRQLIQGGSLREIRYKGKDIFSFGASGFHTLDLDLFVTFLLWGISNIDKGDKIRQCPPP